MVVQTVEITVHVVLKMVAKKSLIGVHTSFQEVPNQPRNTSATHLSVFRILMNWLTTKSQMPVKMPLIPFQHCSQFPENKPINTSSTLRNGIRHKGENIRDMLKYSLKYRCKHTA